MSQRIEHPASLVQLATKVLVRMMSSGELKPGDRVIENRLTQELGISRPPLREALRVLEQQGMITQIPRKGAIVTNLTLHDVYEIYTLRRELERMAVELGVPARDPARLERVRQALARLEQVARAGDAVGVIEAGYEFHAAVIGLSGHRRLEDAYRSLHLQLVLCMAMNRRVREPKEDLLGDAARHRRLFEVIETGDRQAVLQEIVSHGDRAFLQDIEHVVGGHTPESLEWLHRIRTEEGLGQ
ncbi:GntR family transcriptional regulator [Nonomuraea polychroma]|uniref:GntR family transcriptional regulator n=1 Tax=Nonomuraea polychroma TaxID=46176 RepID=A0A438M8G3_9ACTN|nr:GntR family transcriptional regulator [Nonomuraea polychroma]RVX42002.1 GntR family transcriptional regulator [Nonomuraea polychroma]